MNYELTSEPASVLQKILKERGYSMTKPRQVVCALLWGQEPQAVSELARRSQGVIDRASLYRTISLFEKLGLVRRLHIGWKYKVELSEAFVHHHHHISCVRCGKLVALSEDMAVESLLHSLAQQHGFLVTDHQLEIAGVCQMCQRSA